MTFIPLVCESQKAFDEVCSKFEYLGADTKCKFIKIQGPRDAAVPVPIKKTHWLKRLIERIVPNFKRDNKKIDVISHFMVDFFAKNVKFVINNPAILDKLEFIIFKSKDIQTHHYYKKLKEQVYKEYKDNCYITPKAREKSNQLMKQVREEAQLQWQKTASEIQKKQEEAQNLIQEMLKQAKKDCKDYREKEFEATNKACENLLMEANNKAFIIEQAAISKKNKILIEAEEQAKANGKIIEEILFQAKEGFDAAKRAEIKAHAYRKRSESFKIEAAKYYDTIISCAEGEIVLAPYALLHDLKYFTNETRKKMKQERYEEIKRQAKTHTFYREDMIRIFDLSQYSGEILKIFIDAYVDQANLELKLETLSDIDASDVLYKLFILSDDLGCELVLKACEKALINRLSHDKAVEIFNSLVIYDAPTVMSQTVLSYIKSNLAAIISNKTIYDLYPDYLAKLVSEFFASFLVDSNLSSKEAIKLLNLCGDFLCTDTALLLLKCICSEFQLIVSTEDFYKLKSKYLLKLLEDDELAIDSELQLLHDLFAWAKQQQDENVLYTGNERLIDQIRFENFSQKEIKKALEQLSEKEKKYLQKYIVNEKLRTQQSRLIRPLVFIPHFQPTINITDKKMIYTVNIQLKLGLLRREINYTFYLANEKWELCIGPSKSMPGFYIMVKNINNNSLASGQLSHTYEVLVNNQKWSSGQLLLNKPFTNIELKNTSIKKKLKETCLLTFQVS